MALFETEGFDLPQVCHARSQKDRVIGTYMPRNGPRNPSLDRSKKLLCWDVEKIFPNKQNLY
jgi:hypothetical protein